MSIFVKRLLAKLLYKKARKKKLKGLPIRRGKKHGNSMFSCGAMWSGEMELEKLDFFIKFVEKRGN